MVYTVPLITSLLANAMEPQFYIVTAQLTPTQYLVTAQPTLTQYFVTAQ